LAVYLNKGSRKNGSGDNSGAKVMCINNIRAAVAVLGLLVSGLALAQESTAAANASAEVQNARALLNVAREEIINEEMRFSEDEAAAFWPVYERYRSDLQAVRDRFAEVLTSYSEAYRAGTVTEEQANRIVEDYLDIEGDVLRIKKDYLDDFRNVLPARKAARFYQIENKMEIELEYQLSLIVPLVDPV
jgi:hypothetical protein